MPLRPAAGAVAICTLAAAAPAAAADPPLTVPEPKLDAALHGDGKLRPDSTSRARTPRTAAQRLGIRPRRG
jgi:hypothetical protein